MIRKLTVLSLFSGVGAFEKALERSYGGCEVLGFSEVDSHARSVYKALHGVGSDRDLGDVCGVDGSLYRDVDLMTWGFPCTQLSLQGRMTGFKDADGNLTASGLFYEGLRILREACPKVSVIENVPALLGSRFRRDFAVVLEGLTDAGYCNYWTVLDAVNFGVPQSRKRVFIVSIRRDLPVVDYSFCMSDGSPPLSFSSVMDDIDGDGVWLDGARHRYSRIVGDGLSGVVCTCLTTRFASAARVYGIGGSLPTLTTVCNSIRVFVPGRGVRYITLREAWRLMGFSAEDYAVAREVCPSTNALYQMAGNSIVVDVLERGVFPGLERVFEMVDTA